MYALKSKLPGIKHAFSHILFIRIQVGYSFKLLGLEMHVMYRETYNMYTDILKSYLNKYMAKKRVL